MATYSKSFDDYFRIPILLKNLTPLTEKALQKAHSLLYHKIFALEVDDRYLRLQTNPNTEMLNQRANCTQKICLLPEDFNNDWPEFQIIYKTRFIIGLVDDHTDQKQIDETMARTRMENGNKFIGIIYLGNDSYDGSLRKDNLIKLPDLTGEESANFLEPWLYNCLALLESQICNSICEVKRDDENNKTIVFNRMEQKFDAKIMKRKKRYRCVKLCGDYCLTLQLYKQAFDYFNEAEELLKKIDDYLWILGSLQGKLACLAACPSLNVSNQQEYIEALINETYTVAKKTKNWNFECENYFKVARLYMTQPEKFDELMRTFMLNHGKHFHEDQRFLLLTTVGNLYESCGWIRKRNYYYFLAAVIHMNKNSELASLLLLQIAKTPVIQEWPELYKQILQQIIYENKNNTQNNEFYLELLSKCANSLSPKEITQVLAELNYSNNSIMQLQTLEFIKLQEFYAEESPIKPKQNRIGNRESPRKIGGSFFISWKRDENLLFEENEEALFKGTIANKIPFPIRLKITFQVHSQTNPTNICSQEQLYFYLEPANLHKFEIRLRLKGENEQIWIIDKVNLVVWNFNYQISLPNPVKYQIYEKQPELDLIIQNELQFEESSNLQVETSLKNNPINVTICMIKLNISIYYNIDVGFQQNEIVLKQNDQFMGLDFSNPRNIRIVETNNDAVQTHVKEGVLHVGIKKLKTHRRSVNRIQFTLQYIRSMNTKYQISKHYVSKCQFYQQFACKVEEVGSPVTDMIGKGLTSITKIIEETYKIKLRISKVKNQKDNQSYRFHLKEKQYEMSSNNHQLWIEIVKNKIQYDEIQKTVQERVLWENIYNTNIRGELSIQIPFHPLMRKSEKKLTVTMKESYVNNHKQVQIDYNVLCPTIANLSHSITLTPIEIEIDRMYVIRGKTKIEAQATTTLNNKLQIVFGSKCKNQYQICIAFKDGWTYWHEEIISLQ